KLPLRPNPPSPSYTTPFRTSRSPIRSVRQTPSNAIALNIKSLSPRRDRTLVVEGVAQFTARGLTYLSRMYRPGARYVEAVRWSGWQGLTKQDELLDDRLGDHPRSASGPRSTPNPKSAEPWCAASCRPP